MTWWTREGASAGGDGSEDRADGPDPVAGHQVDDPSARDVDLGPESAGPAAPEIRIVSPAGAHVVEVIGPGLHVRGYMRALGGGRLSDHVNLAQTSLHLYEAALVDPDGRTQAILSEDLFVTRRQVVLIAEPTFTPTPRADVAIPKVPREIVAIAPGVVVTGRMYVAEHASVELYLESHDPPFVPLTDVEVQGRMDTRFQARYPFALLNRTQVSAMGLRPMGVSSRPTDDPWAERSGGSLT